MLTTLTLVIGLLAPAKMSRIEVSVIPSDAIVEVNGKRVSSKTAKVPAGKHSVRVRKSGFVTKTRSVETKGGDTVKVVFRLVVSGKKGRKTLGTVTKRPTKKPSVVKVPRKKTVSKRPAAKRPVKKPAKRATTKKPTVRRPVAKKPAKKTTGKKARRPVAKRPVKKRPVKRRPVKRRPVAKRPSGGGVRPVTGGGGNGVDGGTQPSGGTSTKPFAVLSFVVAGLAVTGGVIAGLASDGAAEDFNATTDRAEKTKLKRDADNLALGANIAYGVGATAAVLGVVLWAMDDTDDGYALQAAPLPEGGGLVGIGGVF